MWSKELGQYKGGEKIKCIRLKIKMKVKMKKYKKKRNKLINESLNLRK